MPYFHYRKRKTILSDCFGHVVESEEKPPRFAEAYTRLCVGLAGGSLVALPICRLPK